MEKAVRDVKTGLGTQIRQLRKSQRLTLGDVAHMADLTVSLLSQIETGKTNPSVGTLTSIARALNVPVGAFFSFAEQPASPVVRRSDRKVSYTGSDVNYYLLTPDGPNSPVSVVICEYSAGACSGDFHTHEGMECGFVLSGKLEVLIEGDIYVLNEGDSISFRSNRPHKITNLYDEVTTAIWVDAPALL